jgi:hypothetical protein
MGMEMREMRDEDHDFEQYRQARVDEGTWRKPRKWGGFLRKMQKFENRDPWPQVPFADDLPKFGAWDVVLYTLVVAAVIVFVLFGTGVL